MNPRRGEHISIQDSVFQRYLLFFSLVLCAAVGFYVYKSIHWQVVGDTSIMHYVNFLMDHGLAPYRDIVDINLPGSYFMEGWAMHVFGDGDLGWRFYDFSLLALMIASLIIISLPYDWFAGLYAGVIFLLIHGKEGPWNAGQREQTMITLIMVSYALLFTALRRQKPLLVLPFGFIIGLAASLKPTAAPLGLFLLLMVAFTLRRKSVKVSSYVAYGLLGLVLAFLINLEFLYKYHAFGDFVAISKRLIPYYASIGNKSPYELLRILLSIPHRLILLAGVVLTFINRKEKDYENWERAALVLGILFGASSFVIQRKDFEHHAYSFLVFSLLWSAIEISKAWKKKGWIHAIGLACFAFGVLVVVPALVFKVALTSPRNEQPDALESDLIRLGGPTLQHQVQCFDMGASCYSALYRLKLLPYTTFMGDYMFFEPVGSPPLAYYRNIMWDDLQKKPPKIIIVSNEWLSVGYSFDKLEQWPQLASFLDSAYSLEVTRSSEVFAYRIYVLKNSRAYSVSGEKT
jgi:hypothetical protein